MANDSDNQGVDGKPAHDQRKAKRKDPPEPVPAAMLIHVPENTPNSYKPDSSQNTASNPYKTTVSLAVFSQQCDEGDLALEQVLNGLITRDPLGDFALQHEPSSVSAPGSVFDASVPAEPSLGKVGTLAPAAAHATSTATTPLPTKQPAYVGVRSTTVNPYSSLSLIHI